MAAVHPRESALTVPIDIQRFDAEGFERVTLEAVWTVRKAGRDIAGRRFVASETVARPTTAHSPPRTAVWSMPWRATS
jgi:hypothetical protein